MMERIPHRRAWIAGCLFVAAALLPGCGTSRKPEAPAAYVAEITAWRTQRIERLTSPTGWLSLVGLHWLKEGENTFGADTTNAVVLPQGKAPAFMGTITVADSEITLKVAPGVEVLHNGSPVMSIVLHHDQEKDFEPTVLTHGTLTWFAIERGGRLGIRVKDSDSKRLREFKGIESYTIDPHWRIEGVLVPNDPPKTLEITNVLGTVSHEPSPGALEFKIDGKTYRLDPIAEPGAKELFVVFGDASNGKETYGGGRFLDVDFPGADGKFVLDFNKAYNPPCSFTEFATCPLPPPQNRLPIAVRAGEKAYQTPGH
jgi:hypothetical protein